MRQCNGIAAACPPGHTVAGTSNRGDLCYSPDNGSQDEGDGIQLKVSASPDKVREEAPPEASDECPHQEDADHKALDEGVVGESQLRSHRIQRAVEYPEPQTWPVCEILALQEECYSQQLGSQLPAPSSSNC